MNPNNNPTNVKPTTSPVTEAEDKPLEDDADFSPIVQSGYKSFGAQEIRDTGTFGRGMKFFAVFSYASTM